MYHGVEKDQNFNIALPIVTPFETVNICSYAACAYINVTVTKTAASAWQPTRSKRQAESLEFCVCCQQILIAKIDKVLIKSQISMDLIGLNDSYC